MIYLVQRKGLLLLFIFVCPQYQMFHINESLSDNIEPATSHLIAHNKTNYIWNKLDKVIRLGCLHSINIKPTTNYQNVAARILSRYLNKVMKCFVEVFS